MGCGSSTYPVVAKDDKAGEDPNKTTNLESEGRGQEKNDSSQIDGKLEINATSKQTVEPKSSHNAEKKIEDNKEDAFTTDVSNGNNNVNSSNGEMFEVISHEGSCIDGDLGEKNVMDTSDTDVNGNTGVVETDFLNESGTLIQATSSQGVEEKEKCSMCECLDEKDEDVTSPTEVRVRDTVDVQSECRDSFIDKNVNRFINESTKTNTHNQVEIPQTAIMPSSQELGEKDNCSISESPSEKAVQNDKDVTSLTEVSNHPPSLDNELQKSTDSYLDSADDVHDPAACVMYNSNLVLNYSENGVVQDNELNSQTNCPTLLQAVDHQSSSHKVQDEIVLEQTSKENASPEATSPESTHEIISDDKESLGSDMQKKNSKSALNHTELLKQETNATVEEEKNIVSSPCGDVKEIEDINSPCLDNSEAGGEKKTLKDNETEPEVSDSSNIPCVEEIPPLRDINAENRLITALRLSCKLSPGNLVKDLDTKGVMSLHLMRSLSPGEVTVAELVQKLDNLTELDLSGNLLGPQGFRVICLAVSRNTTLKALNLANNLADTDSSKCIGMMLSANCSLERLDVSGNNLGNDYFSRCVGPALMTNKSLKALKFSSCGSSDASAICEALSQGNSRLEELDASNNHFGAVFGDALSKILQKPGCCLRRLDIHGTNLEKEGMAALLAGMEQNRSLISLNAAGHEVSSLSFLMDFLFACICHPILEELFLEGTKVTEHDEWKLPDAPVTEGSSSLTKMLLSGCSLTNKALQTLSEKIPGKLGCLCYLDVSSNDQLTTECVASIGAMTSSAGQSCLSVLNFSLNAADGIAADIAKLPELKNLKTLLLKKCRITLPSLVDLSKFIAEGKPDSLRISSLTLDGIKLSGTDILKSMLGLSDIFVPTNPCTLELLSLTGCGLNDRDVKPLLSAIGNGLDIKELRLSANRLTDTALNFLVDSSETSLSLEALDLSINKIRNAGAEKLAGAISDKLTNLKSLSLADNSIGKAGILALVSVISPSSQLGTLNLRSQQQPLGEEDMHEIMEQLARKLEPLRDKALAQPLFGSLNNACSHLPGQWGKALLDDPSNGCIGDYSEKRCVNIPTCIDTLHFAGFDLENNGRHAPTCCNLPPNLSINLTGLGGEPGELGPKLDSLAILTDYNSKHRRTLTLEDALQLSAVLSHSKFERVNMSQRDWNLVISAEKDAPAWLQLVSQRESAIYVSNLPLSVTAEKLEGLLDSEAECNVKEVYLLKDQMLRKPNGLAWVLFTDTASVQRAVEYYNSGQAVMYGTPYVISTVNVDITADAGAEKNAKTKARQEMIQRAEDRKADQTAHAQLVQSNYQESLARHEYAAQHPAYADGRVW